MLTYSVTVMADIPVRSLVQIPEIFFQDLKKEIPKSKSLNNIPEFVLETLTEYRDM